MANDLLIQSVRISKLCNVNKLKVLPVISNGCFPWQMFLNHNKKIKPFILFSRVQSLLEAKVIAFSFTFWQIVACYSKQFYKSLWIGSSRIASHLVQIQWLFPVPLYTHRNRRQSCKYKNFHKGEVCGMRGLAAKRTLSETKCWKITEYMFLHMTTCLLLNHYFIIEIQSHKALSGCMRKLYIY